MSDLAQWHRIIHAMSEEQSKEREELTEEFLRVLDCPDDPNHALYHEIWKIALYDYSVQKYYLAAPELTYDLKDMKIAYIAAQIKKAWNKYASFSLVRSILNRREVKLPFRDAVLLDTKAFDDNPKNSYLSRIFVYNPSKNDQWIMWTYNWESEGCFWGHYFENEEEAKEAWRTGSYLVPES